MAHKNILLQNIEGLYLNQERADVWFVINDERIPAHRFIVETYPWLNTMLSGSLPETGDVAIRNLKVTASAFKEFLRFMYRGNIKLTMDNIESVLDLADCSLCPEVFTECENFLIRKVNGENLPFVYGLALLHDRAQRLNEACEDQISINAEEFFQSKQFQGVSYDLLEKILRCNTLAYEEKDIFNACIKWAKAKCRQNKVDESEPLHLRAYLANLIYQIRFSSMSKEEIAICIDSCPGLFNEDELREIICINATYQNYSREKQFNWTPRYFNLRRNIGKELKCFFIKETVSIKYQFKRREAINFTCNRRVLLRGFTGACELMTTIAINFQIIETKTNDIDAIQVERYNAHEILQFLQPVKCQDGRVIYEANFALNRPILLRPFYTYTMNITIDTEPYNLINLCNFNRLKSKVRVDHDIVFHFVESRSVFTSLIFDRLENRKYFRKIVHNPMMWFKMIVLVAIIAQIAPINRTERLSPKIGPPLGQLTGFFCKIAAAFGIQKGLS